LLEKLHSTQWKLHLRSKLHFAVGKSAHKITNLSANEKKQSSAPPLLGETKRTKLNGTSEVMLRISEVRRSRSEVFASEQYKRMCSIDFIEEQLLLRKVQLFLRNVQYWKRSFQSCGKFFSKT
jgi:hypothetical protein